MRKRLRAQGMAAKELSARLNSSLPPEVRVRRARVDPMHQTPPLRLRDLTLSKQYSYYIRTGDFEAASGAMKAQTQHERCRLNVSAMASALAA